MERLAVLDKSCSNSWGTKRYRRENTNEGFYTRFECGFPLLQPFRVWFSSSPLVLSVVSIFSTRFECRFSSSPPVSSVVFHVCWSYNRAGTYMTEVGRLSLIEPYLMQGKIHSKRVEMMKNHTRSEWRRCKTTLETSGEDVKLHSKRVEKMGNHTRNEWRRQVLVFMLQQSRTAG